MPNLSVSIPHQLTRLEARQRVESLVREFQQEHGGLGQVVTRWEADTMHFTVSVAGMSSSGQAFVEDQAVRLEIPLPWPLAMLSGSIKQQIEQQGRKLLGGPS